MARVWHTTSRVSAPQLCELQVSPSVQRGGQRCLQHGLGSRVAGRRGSDRGSVRRQVGPCAHGCTGHGPQPPFRHTNGHAAQDLHSGAFSPATLRSQQHRSRPQGKREPQQTLQKSSHATTMALAAKGVRVGATRRCVGKRHLRGGNCALKGRITGAGVKAASGTRCAFPFPPPAEHMASPSSPSFAAHTPETGAAVTRAFGAVRTEGATPHPAP